MLKKLICIYLLLIIFLINNAYSDQSFRIGNKYYKFTNNGNAVEIFSLDNKGQISIFADYKIEPTEKELKIYKLNKSGEKSITPIMTIDNFNIIKQSLDLALKYNIQNQQVPQNYNQILFHYLNNLKFSSAPNNKSTSKNEIQPTKSLTQKPVRQFNIISQSDGLYSNKYALVIGINKYSGAFHKLEYAVSDAQAITETLQKRGFVVKTLIDEQATKENIIRYLQRIRVIASQNDLIVMYFSGHGHTAINHKGEEEGYLIPVDHKSNADMETALSMGIFKEIADTRKNNQTFFLVDACYSGYGLKKGVSITRPSKLTQEYARKFTSIPAVQVLTAGQKNEQAAEYKGFGIFTYYLLEAMDGAVDYDKAGIVTATDIASYCRKKVTEATFMKQTPQFGWLDGGGEIVFSLAESKQAPISFDSLIKEKLHLSKMDLEKEFVEISILTESGKYNEAEERLIQLSERIDESDDDDNYKINFELASIYSETGKYALGVFHGNIALRLIVKKKGWEDNETARVLTALGINYGNLANYDRAIEYFTKSLDIRLKTLGSEHPDVANSYNNLGAVYDSKGEYDRAIDYYKKSLDIMLKTLGSEHPDVAKSYNNLGIAYGSKGEYDKAIEYHKKSLDIKLKILGSEHPNVAASYNNLGSAYDSKGEYDRAIEYSKKSLDIRFKILGLEHPDVAASYNNLGNAYNSKGEYDRAIEYHKKSLDIRLKTLGSVHPDVATLYNDLGSAYYSKGEYDRAIEYFIKSLDIKLKTLSSEHPDVAASYNNLGIVYRKKGEYDRAIEYFKKSLDIILKTLGSEHPDVAASYNNLGIVYRKKGEYDRAIEYFKKSLDIILKTLGSEHPDVAMSYNNLGGVYYYKKNYSLAKFYYQKAYDIYKKILGEHHSKTLEIKEILLLLDKS